MIDGCRTLYEYFNRDYLFEVDGLVEIEEKSPSGAGVARFAIDGNSIVLKVHNKPPLLWSLRTRKCSDGAFVTFGESGADLHLVEMKSGLDAREWAHALEQFSGMYLTALATLRLLNLTELNSVRCYIAYKKIRSKADTETNPILLKSLVGDIRSIGRVEEFFKESVGLPMGVKAALHHSQRDDAGNADFGAVA